MDLTLEYRGWLKGEDFEGLEACLRRAAARHEWEVWAVEFDDFPLLRSMGEETTMYCGPAKGFSVDFHPHCEPVRFFVEPNGYMEHHVRVRGCSVQTYAEVVDFLREAQVMFDDFAVNDETGYWDTGSAKVLEWRKALEERCRFKIREALSEDADDPDEMPWGGHGFEYADLDGDGPWDPSEWIEDVDGVEPEEEGRTDEGDEDLPF